MFHSSALSVSKLELQLLEGPAAIAEAERDWRALCDRGGAATGFQSFAVASACAAAHLRRGEIPRLVIARRAGRPVLIVPLVVTRWLGVRALRFLGDPLIQYGDVIAAADTQEIDIAAAWVLAASPDAGVIALLRRVREDARTAGYLARHARETLVQETALIALRDRPALNARNARELRRLRRRLAERGPIAVRFLGSAEAEPAIRTALALKREWIRKHGLASSVIGAPDWERALYRMCETGALRAAVLSVGAELAAIELLLLHDGCWYSFLGAFDEAFARMGPGQILTADCIAKASADGLAYFDQLPPVQPYKLQQATSTLSVRDYAMSLSAPGALIAAAARSLPDIKSAFGTLPPELRKVVMALIGR